MTDAAPLAYGQLSVWRIMERYPLERWAETYLRETVSIPGTATVEQVLDGIASMHERHESLRTLFLDAPGGPVQHVLPTFDRSTVEVREHESADGAAARALADELARDRIVREAEFGVRFAVLTRNGQPRHVALAADHIVADGFGLDRVRSELFAALGGRHPEGEQWLSEIAPRPRDLAAEQRSEVGAARMAAVVEHWRQLLRTMPPDVFPVPCEVGESPGRVEAILRSRRLRSDLGALQASARVSPQIVLLALSVLATAAVTGRDQVVMTLQAGNRGRPRWRSLVSSMNQYAPMAIDVGAPGSPFSDFVHRVQTAALDAYRMGSYDIDVITKLVADERGVDLGYDNFYNFMALQLPPVADVSGPPAFVRGDVAHTVPNRQIGPRFDIKVRAGETMPVVVRTDPALVPPAELAGLLRWLDEQVYRLAWCAEPVVGDLLDGCVAALGRAAA